LVNPYDGFNEFVKARTAALSRTAYLLTGDHHSAEDLLQAALSRVAARLAPRQRAVLVLRFYEDLSEVSALGDRLPSAALANGDLVVMAPGTGTLVELSIVDSQTATEKRRIHVDLASYLSPAERAGKTRMDELFAVGLWPRPLYVADDGLAYYETTEAYGSPDAPTEYLDKDLLVIDLATEQVRERVVLPGPKRSTADVNQSETWRLLAVRPDGLLLLHSTTQHALAWELYKPETKQLFLVTDLTAVPGK
jgi:hypothetical protein